MNYFLACRLAAAVTKLVAATAAAEAAAITTAGGEAGVVGVLPASLITRQGIFWKRPFVRGSNLLVVVFVPEPESFASCDLFSKEGHVTSTRTQSHNPGFRKLENNIQIFTQKRNLLKRYGKMRKT